MQTIYSVSVWRAGQVVLMLLQIWDKCNNSLMYPEVERDILKTAEEWDV